MNWVAQTSIKFKSQLNLKCKLILSALQVNLSVNDLNLSKVVQLSFKINLSNAYKLIQRLF